MKNDLIRGHLDLLLLSILAAGPAHGYAVIEELRARSGGKFSLPEGTVYPALHRLEAAGRLRSDESLVDGRRRRVYALTEEGRRALAAGKSEWRTFSRSVESVLGATS